MEEEDSPIYAVVQKSTKENGDPPPIRSEFLVSFLVDKRGGALTGSRGSGIRLIIPPKALEQPIRIKCSYCPPDIPNSLPPLLDGDAIASSGVIQLDCSPSEAKLLRPMLMELPHFCETEQVGRELIVIKSLDGLTWSEHSQFHCAASGWNQTNEEDLYMDVVSQLQLSTVKDDLDTDRIVRVSLISFPKYVAVVSRTRSKSATITKEKGGILKSQNVTVIFPMNCVQKKIKAGLQVRGINQKNLGDLPLGWETSPVLSISPLNRRLHEPIAIQLPLGGWKSRIDREIKVLVLKSASDAPTWEDYTPYTAIEFQDNELLVFTKVTGLFWVFLTTKPSSNAAEVANTLYKSISSVQYLCEVIVFYRPEFPRAWCNTFRIHLTNRRGLEQFSESKLNNWKLCLRRPVSLEEGKYRFRFNQGLVLVGQDESILGQIVDTLDFRPFLEDSLTLVSRKMDQQPLVRQPTLEMSKSDSGATVLDAELEVQL
ncbi:hypothetical protein TCAL_03153 [Tigriopus californicus]|uniref:ZU5 domain-containing protein n=1 Tax=Tigriopus californicus TaxID=6832 RepID=A0A553P3X4_TIGCA|nr:ankyrin-3-like [Tigriopus californicus]TRY72350.1 hypothetical protein TCAL_03153 [Tigriopus californicus]|eukprot:TCALIF_03153-PA protein Name:"Similar to Ank3 Ankyrin-3 (Mus musculus)" AED:0.36 eAED:0.40 QI:0/-1/0/1/-1/1/1/0/484